MNVISRTLIRTASLFRLLMLTSLVIGFSAQAQDSSPSISEDSDVYHQGTMLNLKPGEVLLNRGHWTSRVVDGFSCIKFRGDGSESWNISKCFELGIFELQAEGVAMLTREAGTLILNGELGPESGEGRYSYTADRRFNRYLNRKFDSEEVEFTLPLFLGDMQIDFMDFLEDHYGEVEATELTQLALYSVTQEDFEEYLWLYREYGSKNPVLEDIVAAKLNGIDREYVEELQEAGYHQLSLEQMKQAKAHGVTKQGVEGLRQAGFETISFDLLLRARAHGLRVETVQLLQSLSEEDLTLETIIELQKRGIHDTYIKQLQAVGFTPLSLQQVVKAKAMDIEASFVKSLNEAELETDFHSVLLAKAAALDTAFVNAFAASGLEEVSLDELVTAKQVGLSFDAIESWDELGAGEVAFQELLQAQMLGVNTNDLDAFRKEGVEVYSLGELISAKVHGVDIGFVQQIKGVPVSEVTDTIAFQQEDELESESQASEENTEATTAESQDMATAIARAQEALLNTARVTEQNEAAEVEGDFPRALHEYITMKLNQDALRAQEAQELKRQSEEVNQQEQESALRYIGL